jgi:hypothetical protein
MKSLKTVLPTLFFGMACFAFSSAEAGLINSAVSTTNVDVLASMSAVVGSGAEFTAFNGSMLFDFTDNQLLVTFDANADTVPNINFGDGFILSFDFVKPGMQITGITLLSASNFDGGILLPDNIAALPDSIVLNFSNTNMYSAASLTFDISTQNSVVDVPEPLVSSLMGAGLLALAMANRRRPMRSC